MKNSILLMTLSLSLICTGCVSTQKRPVNEIATARASITLAEQNGAQQLSLADLTKARQKLARANNLSGDGEYEAAERLAIEATVDARVAAAQATLMKSEQAAEELNSAFETLESELNRNNRQE